MASWYYVDGSERVGPIGIEILSSLYSDQKINAETYVWRKGFANWERLKNVDELQGLGEVAADEENKSVLETIQSIDAINWNEIDHNESRFYLKVGRDRHASKIEYYGPYNTTQLVAAFENKRINDRTLIFTLGMDDWQPISSLSYFKNLMGFVSLSLPIISKAPLYFAYQMPNQIHGLLVKEINKSKALVLTDLSFVPDTTIQASLFVGDKLVKNNVMLTIEKQNAYTQEVDIILDHINSDVEEAIEAFHE